MTAEEKDREKQLAAAAAVELVQPEMVVGLGSGSTSAHFIRLLGEKMKEKKMFIYGVPTSGEAETAAIAAGITCWGLNKVRKIDLAVDGADEFDADLTLIKGGGGAHFREKIVACNARRFVVIADSSKRVAKLGKFPLAVEVAMFGAEFTLLRIQRSICPEADFRMDRGDPFETDSRNYLVDCPLGEIEDAPALAAKLDAIPGVLGHGIFIRMVDTLIVGANGGVEVIPGNRARD